MKFEPPIDINREKQLMDALASLPESAEPSRDLWPEISHNIAKRETNTYTQRWIPWAFAATLLISFSSVIISWSHLESAQKIVVNNQIFIKNDSKRDIQSQIKSMEQEFGLAKSVLLTQIALNSNKTNANLMQDVQSNLIIIEQATSQLKLAINQQPENPSLPKLLQSIYQQELTVLIQLAKLGIDV